MASNFFGQIFRITTFGESHGKGIGVVIDGCPAGLALSVDEVNEQLRKRRPGSLYTSPRKESDEAEILSGLFEGKTTGAPLAIWIANRDVDSSHYEPIKNLFRPGHGNYTYLQKYGIFDYRGGGRASARETAARVAAGAVAKKLLAHYGIETYAFVQELAGISIQNFDRENILKSPIFCPDPVVEKWMINEIEKAKAEGDSVGAVLQCTVNGLPAGFGDPVYSKLEASLASAMLSIPAAKGFEIGSGFAGARMKGSAHNDAFELEGEQVTTRTNHAGGVLAGISTGLVLSFRVAFKPTSSIRKEQDTVSMEGKKEVFKMPEGARHDPCVAIRAVPIVEAMTALVLADAWLLGRCSKI